MKKLFTRYITPLPPKGRAEHCKFSDYGVAKSPSGDLRVLILFIFCLTSTVQSQTFSSRKLTELGEMFPKTCLPRTDSIFNCAEVTKGKSFVVRYNRKNEIEHFGVSLFSPETKEIIGLPICNFIERIMLELLLQKSSAEVKSKLSEYKISLEQNGAGYGQGTFTSLSRMLDEIQSPAHFGIQKDSICRAGWEFKNGKHLKMTFPASRELISGMDKKESDESVGELFAGEDCRLLPVNTDNTVSANKMTPIKGSDLYLLKGTVFMINQITSDSYYLRSDNRYYPVFSAGYPGESLVNLFITKQINNSLTLQITHRMYGGFTPGFTIPLNRFICLFDKEFSSYCVLHRSDFGNVQVSIILHNRDLNYVHLLRIKTTAKQMFRENGILAADFYTNIPIHNLKSLFSQ